MKTRLYPLVALAALLASPSCHDKTSCGGPGDCAGTPDKPDAQDGAKAGAAGNSAAGGDAGSPGSGGRPSFEGGIVPEGGLAEGGDSDAGVDGIVGHRVIHRILDTEIVDVPSSLTNTMLEALVPHPDGHGFDTFSGAGDRDGNFSIPHVPSGRYYLHVFSIYADAYFVTSARNVDLSVYDLGRPTFTLAGPGTTLTFNVTNLAAWQPTDDLQFVASNVGTVLGNLASDATSGAPGLGNTALSGMQYDYYAPPGTTLIRADQGDQLWLTQLATKSTTSGTKYRALAKTLSTKQFTLASGVNNVLAGAFSDTPQSETLSTTWNHNEFAQYLASTNPTATYRGQLLLVGVVSGGLTHGGGDTTDLIVYEDGNIPQTTNEAISMTYGNPFPSGFGVMGYAEYTTRVQLSLPNSEAGVVAPYVAKAVIYTKAPVTAFNANGVAPVVSPVRNPTVESNNAFSSVSGVGLTPTVAWTAPSLGKPSLYEVRVTELAATGTAVQKRGATHLFRTSQTSLQIPPGIFQAGKDYMVEVDACVGSYDWEAQPYADVMPSGKAAAILGVVSP